MMYMFKTMFDKEYRAFYIYTNGRLKMGCIPCGIECVYRGKPLGTINLMELILKVTKHDGFPSDIIKNKSFEWFSDDGKINSKLMYEVTRQLEKKVTF